MSNIFIFS